MIIKKDNPNDTINNLIVIKTKKGSLTKDELNELKDYLKEASYNYYNTENIIMGDTEYDILYTLFIYFGGKEFTGAKPSKNKKIVSVKHNFNELVGTLSKQNFIYEKDMDENSKKQGLSTVEQWLNNIFKKFPNEKFDIAIEFKFDGNSVCIEYVDGKPKMALTRGENGEGMDLTDVFKDHRIKSTKDVGIKYEIIITWDDFKKLCKELNKDYANPRSLVAGKLGSNDAYKYYKYITLVPLWCRYLDKNMDREKQLKFIEKNFGKDNLLFNDFRIIEGISSHHKNHFYKELRKMYKKYENTRDKLPFMIDGIVIEIIDQSMRDKLGYANDKPNWATALKFPYLSKVTKITNFDFCLGDSGIITPRAWFEPVKFNGSVHQKQSLQNYKRFKELKLGIGTEINVAYHNDCLSYITPIDTENNKKIKPFEFPKDCPVCHSPIIIDPSGARARCSNPNCIGIVLGKIKNYLVKMNIKGIKENTIEKLYKAGLLTSIENLYNMDYSKIPTIDGFGEMSAISIKGAIESKVPYDYEILGSLMIDGIGIKNAKEICKNITLEDLLNEILSDKLKIYRKIIKIDGFSDILAGSLINGVEINQNTIKFLLNRNHYNLKDEINKGNNNSNTKSMSIVFTEFRDPSLQFELEKNGHIIKSAVSKKTDMVVTTNPNGNTTKLKKARELNIPILELNEFKKKYGY